MHKQLLPPDLSFRQYAYLGAGELLEVEGGGLTLGDVVFDQGADAAAGVFEEEWHQGWAVEVRELGPDVLVGGGDEGAECGDFAAGPVCGLGDAVEDEDYPVLPVVGGGDVVEQAVVVVLVLEDVAAEAEDGEGQ